MLFQQHAFPVLCVCVQQFRFNGRLLGLFPIHRSDGGDLWVRYGTISVLST